VAASNSISTMEDAAAKATAKEGDFFRLKCNGHNTQLSAGLYQLFKVSKMILFAFVRSLQFK